MPTKERREGADGCPAGKEACICITYKSADVISCEWNTGESHAVHQPYTEHHVFVIGNVVAGPYRRISLNTGKARTRKVKRPPVFHQGFGTLVRAACHLKPVDVCATAERGLFPCKIELDIFGQHVAPGCDFIPVIPEPVAAKRDVCRQLI